MNLIFLYFYAFLMGGLIYEAFQMGDFSTVVRLIVVFAIFIVFGLVNGIF